MADNKRDLEEEEEEQQEEEEEEEEQEDDEEEEEEEEEEDWDPRDSRQFKKIVDRGIDIFFDKVKPGIEKKLNEEFKTIGADHVEFRCADYDHEYMEFNENHAGDEVTIVIEMIISFRDGFENTDRWKPIPKAVLKCQHLEKEVKKLKEDLESALKRINNINN